MIKSFNQIINNQLTSYKGMYECDCAHLCRSLPFRTIFTSRIVDDIVTLFPPTTTKNLVYVAQGPGGLFFDFVLINKLVNCGYQTITIIVIEELYQENIDIIQACLDFKTWFKELRQHHSNYPTVTPYFYASQDEYAQACKRNSDLRGHILVTVDPDDNQTAPNFEAQKFRASFSATLQTILRAKAAFYTLFFQNTMRHMLLGRTYHHTNQQIVTYEHHYGNQSFTDKHNRLFLDNHEVAFFEPIEYGIQINGHVNRSKKLAGLLQAPLQKINPFSE